jgi:hypothetical protein
MQSIIGNFDMSDDEKISLNLNSYWRKYDDTDSLIDLPFISTQEAYALVRFNLVTMPLIFYELLTASLRNLCTFN